MRVASETTEPNPRSCGERPVRGAIGRTAMLRILRLRSPGGRVPDHDMAARITNAARPTYRSDQ